MERGYCHLCGRFTDLIDSHVWPKLAYKRFASDLSKGGQFVDLREKNLHANRQYKRFWFCTDCDGKVIGQTETYAASLLDRLQAAPTNQCPYDANLIRFAVSISWRTAKFETEERCQKQDDSLRKACKRWKDFLRGKTRTLGPYTQYLFVVFDPTVGLHNALGGRVFLEEHIVLSQIGPMFIISLLDRKHISLQDLAIWDNAEVCRNGGVILPITKWCVGKNVTMDFARFLWRSEVRTKKAVLEIWENEED